MQTEVHREANEAGAQDASACPNCHNLMPNGMRFCRACGCRLGEGVEEYTETVRLDGARATAGAARTKTASAFPPANVKDWGGVARNAREQAMRSMTAGLRPWKMGRTCSSLVPKWMIWVFLPIIAVSIMGGISSNKRVRGVKGGDRAAASSSAPSYMGAEYKTAQGGVLIRDVSPPGSAADKAGLIGGDVITSYDGKPVKSDGELSGFLGNTPVGKTVDVTFVRDGETKTVKLTTVSEDDNDNLREAFGDVPKGFLGVNDNFQRVQVPNTSIYGVQLKEVYKNKPAYIAGLRDGDIVIEFNGTPIRTTEEFNDRIDRATPDSTVKVVVMRGSERQEIMVKMGIED
jgi:membrane-associated protease RseP (regulator of RpoE activity)